jgi:hypothetical protein
MKLYVFNKQILTPPKCGSRFLYEVYNIDREYIDLFDIIKIPLTSNIKWVVLRTPMDLLISALHTEFIEWCWNRKSQSLLGGLSKENKFLEEKKLLNKFIIDINSQLHWHHQLFKYLYLFGVSLPTPPTIVMLDDLNDFLTKEMGIEKLPIFDEVKYNFSNYPIWLSKSELIQYLIKTYPQQWIEINTLLKTDELFWYKIQNQFSIWK